MKKHCVVFDGTSSFVVPFSELESHLEDFDTEFLCSFSTLDKAVEFSDDYNKTVGSEI